MVHFIFYSSDFKWRFSFVTQWTSNGVFLLLPCTNSTPLAHYALWASFSALWGDSDCDGFVMYFCWSLKNSLVLPHTVLVHIGHRRTFCVVQDLPESRCSFTRWAKAWKGDNTTTVTLDINNLLTELYCNSVTNLGQPRLTSVRGIPTVDKN